MTDDTFSLLNAARQHTEIGAYRKALDALGRALRASPRDPAVWFEIGSVLCQDGDIEEAIEAYDHVTDLAPGNAQAHFQKGVLLAQLGRTREAKDAFGRSIALSPDFADVVARTLKS
jgi:tetratricopeptide (TPR) repeat protein